MKILKKNIILSIFFIPLFFIACVKSKLFNDPYFTAKTLYFFFVVTAITVVSGIWLIFLKKQKKIGINSLDLAILIYAVYYLVRLHFTPYQSMEEPAALVMSFSFLVYFILRIYLELNHDNSYILKILIFGILGGAIIQGILGIFQYLDIIHVDSKYFDIIGSFINPGPFTNYLVAVLPIAIGYNIFLTGKTKQQALYWIALIAMLIMLLVIILANARTAWITAIVIIALIVFNRFKDISVIKKIYDHWCKKAVIIMLILLLSGATGWHLFNYKKDSSLGRIFIWKIAVEIIKDHPVTGTGINTYAIHHNNYQADYFKTHVNTDKEGRLADNIKFAFNEYLNITVEQGFAGLLLLLLILYLAIKAKPDYSLIKNNYIKTCMLLFKYTIIAILITAFFSYPFHNTQIIVILFVALAVVATYLKPAFHLMVNKSFLKLTGLILLLGSIWHYSFQKERLDANRQWNKAIVYMQKGNKKQALNIYKRLYPVLKYDKHFLYNYGSELSLIGHYKKSITILKEAEKKLNDADLYIYLGNSYEKLGKMEKAAHSFEKASYIIPHRLYPKYRLVYIYLNTGKDKKAREMAEKILAYDEKISNTTTKMIKLEIKKLLKEL